MSLKNKVVLVAGGSSYIGAMIAIKFIEKGAKVARVERNETKTENKAKNEQELQIGHKPLVIIADISKEEDIKRILISIIRAFGKLDVLVNNLDTGEMTSIFSKGVLESFDRVVATNLRAVVQLTHLALPYLVKTKGNIINASSSVIADVITPSSFVYHMSKAGLDHFTRCVALELASKGVRVNAVIPEPVRPDSIDVFFAKFNAVDATSNTMEEGTSIETIIGCEVANYVAYLASDEARSISGTCMVIDSEFALNGCPRIFRRKNM